MIGPHIWKSNPIGTSNYTCARCGAAYVGSQGPACLAPEAPHERIAGLLADAEALAVDLRTARDAAPAGQKADYRYPLRAIESAAALIRKAGI